MTGTSEPSDLPDPVPGESGVFADVTNAVEHAEENDLIQLTSGNFHVLPIEEVPHRSESDELPYLGVYYRSDRDIHLCQYRGVESKRNPPLAEYIGYVELPYYMMEDVTYRWLGAAPDEAVTLLSEVVTEEAAESICNQNGR